MVRYQMPNRTGKKVPVPYGTQYLVGITYGTIYVYNKNHVKSKSTMWNWKQGQKRKVKSFDLAFLRPFRVLSQLQVMSAE